MQKIWYSLRHILVLGLLLLVVWVVPRDTKGQLLLQGIRDANRIVMLYDEAAEEDEL